MKNLKEIRIKRKYTQQEMAQRLHITQATYSGYESGKYSPNIDMLCAISGILETPIDEIVGNVLQTDDNHHNKWLLNNIIYKVKRLNEKNLFQLDGFLTAKIEDQDDEERKDK